MAVKELSIVLLLKPFRERIDAIRRKMFIPTMVYTIAAFVIGIPIVNGYFFLSA
jgi:hypothetical protein